MIWQWDKIIGFKSVIEWMVDKYLIIVRLFIPSKKRLDIIIIIINTLMIICLVSFQVHPQD